MLGKKKKDETFEQPVSSNINLNKQEDDFNDFFDEPEEEYVDGYDQQYQTQNYGYEQQGYQQAPVAPNYVEDTQVVDKKAAKKDKKKNKKGKAVDVTAEPIVPKEKPKMVLYIVIDRPVGGMINYLRECGVKVSAIFNNITDIKNTVLMQSEPTRVVVVDTGLGKFSATAMRKELVDMFGISDEQNRTTVFFTDSVIKMETTRELGRSGSKHIEWLPYKSTAIIAATLLSYDEEYVYDSEDKDDAIPTEAEILGIKGLPMKEKYESSPMDIRGMSSESIIQNLFSDHSEALPGYKVRL